MYVNFLCFFKYLLPEIVNKMNIIMITIMMIILLVIIIMQFVGR